jgi:hypothetical protein
MERYFGVILARDSDALRSLQQFDLDLFPQTAKRSALERDFPFSIDGLLTLAEIDKVVKAGYKVQINESADQRAASAESPAEFSQWLAGMEADLTQERAMAKKTAAKKASPKKK